MVKEVALGRFGYDYYDKACYNNIATATIPIGADMAQRFVKNKDQILKAMGAYWFPELSDTPNEPIARANACVHRFDMAGTTYGFNDMSHVRRTTQNLLDPHDLTIHQLNDGGGPFNVGAFFEEKAAQTKWVADQLPQMRKLIENMRGGDRLNATLREFINQDYEGTARLAKIHWAIRHHQHPFSKQHASTSIGIDADHTPESVAQALTNEVSEILGYHQEISPKPMKHRRPTTMDYVLLHMRL